MNPEFASVLPDAVAGDRELSGGREGEAKQVHQNSNRFGFHPSITSAPANDVMSENASGPRPETVSDESLFEQLSRGQQEALGILFRRHARMVRAVAYRILRDASEADDLLQEVFLYLHRKANLFEARRGTARSWIVQVTYHRAIDRRRYLISRHFYSSGEIENTTEGLNESRTEIAFYERSIEGTLGRDLVKKIDEALTENQRKIIQLYFFEGYTVEEIAELLRQTPGNVRNYYYRGLECMRRQIFTANLRVK